MKQGAGGWIILLLFVLLVLNLPLNGQTLIQRIKAGASQAAQYAESKSGAGTAE